MRLEELLAVPVRLRQVYIAVAVAGRRSVRDASEMLYLTQPATSRSLRELEDVLGLRLFDRTAAGMVPTEAGEALLPHLQLISAEVDALLRHAQDLRTGTGGRISVGTVLAGSARLLPDAVLALKEDDPMIAVQIVEGSPSTLHEQLLRGDLDLIVGRTMPLTSLPGVAFEVLQTDSVTVVAPAGHPMAGATALAELVDQPWVLPPSETSLRQQVDTAFMRNVGRGPDDIVECVSPVPLRRMLIGGGRVGIVPSGVFREDLDRGDLVALAIEMEGTTVPVGVITRAGMTLPGAAHRLLVKLKLLARDGTGEGLDTVDSSRGGSLETR